MPRRDSGREGDLEDDDASLWVDVGAGFGRTGLEGPAEIELGNSTSFCLGDGGRGALAFPRGAAGAGAFPLPTFKYRRIVGVSGKVKLTRIHRKVKSSAEIRNLGISKVVLTHQVALATLPRICQKSAC